jgi:Ribosomal protein L23
MKGAQMNVLRYPVATEKAVNLISKNNVITYIVNLRATKQEIKKEFESLFKVKVSKVRTINSPTNMRKAFITIAKGYNASDVAMKLKLV